MLMGAARRTFITAKMLEGQAASSKLLGATNHMGRLSSILTCKAAYSLRPRRPPLRLVESVGMGVTSSAHRQPIQKSALHLDASDNKLYNRQSPLVTGKARLK